ncbi:MAG: permease [Marinobacter sp.]|uniref:permease n=1 Tax=Marinobacter sp. TaxID=50741 RepID=UPI0032991B86
MSQEMQDTLGMFAFLAIELSFLFLLISWLVGILQRYVPQEKIAALLSARQGRSYLLAAFLGAITPFCSCSTIPLLKGLIRARAGFGPMMVFLFASPLLNPIIVVLLAATFGLELTGIYVTFAFLVSLIAGWSLQSLGFERYVLNVDTVQGCKAATGKPQPAKDAGAGCSGGSSGGSGSITYGQGYAAPNVSYYESILWDIRSGKFAGLWSETWSDFRKVLPYLMLGISIGSVIYGFVPTGLLAEYAGANKPFAIPFAALIGAPLYIRAEAVIPLAAALLGKGVSAGAVMALIIGSAGASLTEVILLKSLFRSTLVAVFLAVVIGMAISAGYATYLLY